MQLNFHNVPKPWAVGHINGMPSSPGDKLNIHERHRETLRSKSLAHSAMAEPVTATRDTGAFKHYTMELWRSHPRRLFMTWSVTHLMLPSVTNGEGIPRRTQTAAMVRGRVNHMNHMS